MAVFETKRGEMMLLITVLLIAPINVLWFNCAYAKVYDKMGGLVAADLCAGATKIGKFWEQTADIQVQYDRYNRYSVIHPEVLIPVRFKVDCKKPEPLDKWVKFCILDQGVYGKVEIDAYANINHELVIFKPQNAMAPSLFIMECNCGGGAIIGKVGPSQSLMEMGDKPIIAAALCVASAGKPSIDWTVAVEGASIWDLMMNREGEVPWIDIKIKFMLNCAAPAKETITACIFDDAATGAHAEAKPGESGKVFSFKPDKMEEKFKTDETLMFKLKCDRKKGATISRVKK